MAMSQFRSNVEQYYGDGRMETADHKRKVGKEETVKQRYDRYARDENGESIPNSLIDQKMLRQKYGHLFEIVTSTLSLSKSRVEFLQFNPCVISSKAPDSFYFFFISLHIPGINLTDHFLFIFNTPVQTLSA